MKGKVRDDFAGPGGWSTAINYSHLAELLDEIGVEFDDVPALTARRAGHRRMVADVQKVRHLDWSGLKLYIASPPCQTFSRAGKGDGRKHLESVLRALELVADGATPEEAIAAVTDAALDWRTTLVLEPMLVIRQWRPSSVAFEQVPPVLPIWEAYAEILRTMGYSAWTGFVTTEMYGVPQTRKRAVLMASLEREITGPPPPTHSRYYSRSPERLDDGMPRWVSMAEALGWGGDELVGFPRLADRAESVEIGGVEYRARDLRPASSPAQVVTEKSRSWTRFERDAVVAEVTGRVNNQSGTEFDLSWPLDRPAPVVAGREIITMPGANANRFNGSTKSRNDGIRVTAEEAGVLQGFPADYPWSGTRTQQFQQVGDAFPPLMALHVLCHTLGVPLTP